MHCIRIFIRVAPSSQCNRIGVCAPLPGPNNLGVIHTWNGVLMDLFLIIALPLFTVGFRLKILTVVILFSHALLLFFLFNLTEPAPAIPTCRTRSTSLEPETRGLHLAYVPHA